MNPFYGKKVHILGTLGNHNPRTTSIMSKPDMIRNIERLGGTLVYKFDANVDILIAEDDADVHAEPLWVFMEISPEHAVVWIQASQMTTDILPDEEVIKLRDINSSDDAGKENTFYHAVRCAATELLHLRKQLADALALVPAPPAEVKVDLETVSDDCLNRYCEISDLDTLFLYEIRKIAREAKRARNSTSAQRWDALLSSPAIRILGHSSVIKNPSESGYAHFGMEIWSIHSGRYYGGEQIQQGRDILTAYADIMIRNNARINDIKISLPADRSGVVKRGEIKGNDILMTLEDLELDAILQSKTDEEALTLFTSSVKSRGVSTDVELVLVRE